MNSKFYQPSTRIKKLFAPDIFDLRFVELKNSLINSGFLKSAAGFIDWRINYKN